MRKEGALMVANRELSEKQKGKIEKEINYMFYELYTKRKPLPKQIKSQEWTQKEQN